MSGYWVRIAIRALVIFGIGMLVWTGVRRGKAKVESIANSADPLRIPLAFISFKLDGRDLGTLNRLEILRTSPKKVRAVNFRVKLANPADSATLAQCLLVAQGDVRRRKDNVTIEGNTVSFNCAQAGDTAGRHLVPLGALETTTGGTFTLLAPREVLTSFDFSTDAAADSAREAAQALADSITDAADSTASAMQAEVEAKADSLRAQAERRADSVRAAARAQAEAVRNGEAATPKAGARAGGTGAKATASGRRATTSVGN